MRVLITGDKGFIGSHLKKYLEDKGHEVYGISKRDVDLRVREDAYNAIIGIEPEVVFHLAADAAEGRSLYSPSEITSSSLDTFYNVIAPAINGGKLKRVVFTSSIAVYGQIHTPFKETDSPQPVDIYGIAKYAIEMGLRSLAEAHNFEYVIARPHNVYGPNQNMSDPYRNVVTLFMNHILKGEPYSIFGDGSMSRQFSYVGDVVEVLAQMMYKDVNGCTFNVGSDKSYTIKELSDTILDITSAGMTPNYLPQRVHEVWNAQSDHTLANKVFGYKDTPFREGLIKTWEWVAEQGPKDYVFKIPEIESGKYPKNWNK